jgi:hypothetical protein
MTTIRSTDECVATEEPNMDRIECESCHKVFVGETAYKTHFSYDLKPDHVANIEDAEARYPERRRCGNDFELAGRGLTNHFWMSVNGPQDAYWTNGPS